MFILKRPHQGPEDASDTHTRTHDRDPQQVHIRVRPHPNRPTRNTTVVSGYSRSGIRNAVTVGTVDDHDGARRETTNLCDVRDETLDVRLARGRGRHRAIDEGAGEGVRCGKYSAFN